MTDNSPRLIAMTGKFPEDFGYKVVADPLVGFCYAPMTLAEIIHHQSGGEDLDKMIADREHIQQIGGFC